MKREITTRCISDRVRLGVARHHAVVTDRMVQEGGTDIGCTSGELLLLAIGSCAAGGVSSYLQAQGCSTENLSVAVFFEAHEDPRERDRIVVSVKLDAAARQLEPDAIRTAAVSGGVTSRMYAGKGLVVRMDGIT